MLFCTYESSISYVQCSGNEVLRGSAFVIAKLCLVKPFFEPFEQKRIWALFSHNLSAESGQRTDPETRAVYGCIIMHNTDGRSRYRYRSG